MLLAAGSALATLLHALLCLGVAPVLAGGLAWVQARAQGRRGPPVQQPIRHLRRLLAKETIGPDTATALYPVWPYIAFAATLTAVLLVPGFSLGLLTAPLGDVITILGLLALARVAGWLGAMDSGTAFGGAAAARDALFSLYAEGAALVALLTLALITGQTQIDGIARTLAAGAPVVSVALGFALMALLAVGLAQTADALGSAQAGMRLDYSGRHLALLTYAGMLRRLLWMDLIGTLFWPFGMAVGDRPLTWPMGLAVWGAKLSVMAVALAVFQGLRANISVARVPAYLGVAILLGVLASLLLLVAPVRL